MKLTGLASFFLLGSSIASPANLAPRDMSVIKYNLQRVEFTVKELDKALDVRAGFDQASQQAYFSKVLQVNQQLIQELTVGAMEIRKGPDANALDGLQLGTMINPPLATFEKVSNTFIRVKRSAQAVGAQQAVLDGLIYLSMQGGLFIDSVILRSNYLGPGVGAGHRQRLVTAIDKAIAEYKKK